MLPPRSTKSSTGFSRNPVHERAAHLVFLVPVRPLGAMHGAWQGDLDQMRRFGCRTKLLRFPFFRRRRLVEDGWRLVPVSAGHNIVRMRLVCFRSANQAKRIYRAERFQIREGRGSIAVDDGIYAKSISVFAVFGRGRDQRSPSEQCASWKSACQNRFQKGLRISSKRSESRQLRRKGHSLTSSTSCSFFLFGTWVQSGRKTICSKKSSCTFAVIPLSRRLPSDGSFLEGASICFFRPPRLCASGSLIPPVAPGSPLSPSRSALRLCNSFFPRAKMHRFF